MVRKKHVIRLAGTVLLLFVTTMAALLWQTRPDAAQPAFSAESRMTTRVSTESVEGENLHPSADGGRLTAESFRREYRLPEKTSLQEEPPVPEYFDRESLDVQILGGAGRNGAVGAASSKRARGQLHRLAWQASPLSCQGIRNKTASCETLGRPFHGHSTAACNERQNQ